MKKYLITTIFLLLAVICVMQKQVKYANERWETATANIKAYDAQLASSGERNIALQLTIDQLNSFKDSVLIELNETKRELGIKDKNLKALQQVSSSFSKTDTIIFRDTLFRDAGLEMDTLLGDEWYTLRLGLSYPSMITVKPEFRSEKHIIVSSKKETVNPPKRFFLLRWFQKKHRVLQVDVVEKNPYVEEESSRYVEVMK